MTGVDKSSQRVRRMFGEIARRYDLLNHVLSLGVDRSWRRRTVRLVPPADGAGPVLDLCTGTGDLALAYVRAHPAARVLAADFCHPMLAIARQKCRRSPAGRRIGLVEADALELPFPDNTFQVVAVAFGLRNLSDLDQGLREMARVCRPGGRVAVLEFSTPRTRPLGTLYAWYFRRLLPWIGQTLAPNRQSAYNYLPASVGLFPQAEALMERMLRAGLTHAQQHPLSFGIATLYVGAKP
ncbi:MAG: bifunctional demethylmenaquinone methyltransferase/2-methoxy-6-polyprenyl-1,4-benzoquinol methylase UbiE [Thermoguttaceae bacterium]|jgi:demethylmenaquinone methyltransferase/2-methoxy-6-polyprenyl-1,4-benzoquinol methylase